MWLVDIKTIFGSDSMLFVHYNEKLKINFMKIIDRGITIAYKNISMSHSLHCWCKWTATHLK